MIVVSQAKFSRKQSLTQNGVQVCYRVSKAPTPVDRRESKVDSAEGEAELSCGTVPMKAQLWSYLKLGCGVLILLG